MEHRNINVTILSAEDLEKVTLFSKMQPYAVVYVDPYYRLSTRVDKEGNTNPCWNELLSLPVSDALFRQPGSSFLRVEIRSKGSLLGDKFVGMASIPLSELLQRSNGEEEVVVYHLRRSSGKVKGIVRLSVHVNDNITGQAASAMPVNAYSYDPQKPYNRQGYNVSQPYPQSQPPQPYSAQGYYVPPPQQQSYYQQPPPYVQPPPNRRPGMGFGTGLLAGALGGFVVGDMIGDAFGGGGDDGGFDGGDDGGF
ncbi:hypothetical protein KP509_23G001700 [Ceratopteris richardii]|uniref:C2 domain-containing protein n=1 Tax=Ceratopteris richardii TaxID=49495 RepID=A0A8T2RZP3_CERRI|nr:hypothetical protein KP509_23G001700 [Ceratopteris richardii]